jgi:hypothetical protein
MPDNFEPESEIKVNELRIRRDIIHQNATILFLYNLSQGPNNRPAKSLLSCPSPGIGLIQF